MKWIGQNIYDLIARFRNDVYLESLSTTTETNVLVVDSSGKISKSTSLADDIIESEIDTLTGLTAMGNANNLVMSYSDIQWYNPVNDGNPQYSFGSSSAERFIIQPFYDSGAQTLDFVKFNTIEASSTANKGQYIFQVDSVSTLSINDSGLNLYTDKALTINGENIISDSSGTATLSNIDALDATTEATIEAAIDTLANLTSVGTLTSLQVDNININGSTVTASADLALVATGNDVTVDTDNFVIESATSLKPQITLKNTTNDATSGSILFQKDRGTAAVNGDIIGILEFNGENDAQEASKYGRIQVEALEVDDTDEAGKMSFIVGESNGTASGLTAGLVIEGSDNTTDGEVNVDIAAGAASVTTIAGTLTMGSTAAITNAGLLSVANQSNVTGVGTISSGVWNGTAIASAYLDSDTAHLSGTQTFTGAKTFTDTVALTGTGRITGVDTVSADTDAASKVYADRPAKQIQIYHANWKGAAGTGLTYIPLAGVPDETIGSGGSVGAKESNAIIMPAAGKIKEIILRQHWTSTITTSDDITWTVYNRASNKKVNAFTAIGSTFDMVNPTQGGTDANNTRTSGEISYDFAEYDAVVISMQWASTGPTNNSDRHFVTVVVEYDFSGIGY